MKRRKRRHLTRNQNLIFFYQNLFPKAVFMEASGVAFRTSKTDSYSHILIKREEVELIITNGFHERR